MTLFQRKYRIESARLPRWDYRARGRYFVTICTRHRACLFGKIQSEEVNLSPIGSIADSDLRTLHEHYENVWTDEHVVMPNHVHAIIAIEGDHEYSPMTRMSDHNLVFATTLNPPKAGSLSSIIRSYKAGVSRRCHELGFEQDIWQPRFHDHLLRGDKVIEAVRLYIRNNPANWGKDKENPFRPGCQP